MHPSRWPEVRDFCKSENVVIREGFPAFFILFQESAIREVPGSHYPAAWQVLADGDNILIFLARRHFLDWNLVFFLCRLSTYFIRDRFGQASGYEAIGIIGIGRSYQEQKMKLSDIVVTDALRAKLTATTRDDAIKELIEALAEAGAIPAKNVASIAKAVIARETQATTGIGKGISLPHAKIKGLKSPIATFGGIPEGLDFSSLDSQPVYSVILLLSNPDNPDEHLQAMETIFRHVQRDMFRKFLRQAETNEAIVDLIQEADEMS